MFTGIYQTVTLLAAATAFYLTDVIFMRRWDRERTSSTGKSKYWGFTLAVIAAAAIVIVQPVLLPWLGLRTEAWWGLLMQGMGILAVLGGLILHAWSRAHLRQFYAEGASVVEEHYVVTTGPYAYVRHPMFASYFLIVVSFVLINPAVTTVLMAAYTFWDFTQAALRDEELLVKEVPGYENYVKRTPRRFVPRLADLVHNISQEEEEQHESNS